jgi:hypothetical protein
MHDIDLSLVLFIVKGNYLPGHPGVKYQDIRPFHPFYPKNPGHSERMNEIASTGHRLSLTTQS